MDFSCNLAEVLTSPGLIASESWLEVVYWVGGITVAVFAFLAYRQRAKLEGVRFLLDLEKEWNELASARKEFSKVYHTVLSDVHENHPHLSDVAKKSKLEYSMSKALNKLRFSGDDADREIYINLINYLSFYEKIGFLEKHRFVPVKYLLELFKEPILQASIMFEKHIEEWQEMPGVAPGLYEGALYLFRRARRKGR